MPSVRQGQQFDPPSVPPLAVARPRISSRLDLALHQRLSMVVAPPGYGKTVLVAQWAASHPKQRVRWLTLVPQHDDPTRWASDLRAALDVDRSDRAGAGSGVDVVEPPSSFVDDLLDDVERMAPATLVLDDFHVLSSAIVLDDLAALVEHAPRSLRFVLVARSDPPSRFYRLGMTESLIELRQEDLRFDAEEAVELVERLAGRWLRPSQIESLLARTEGWAVGLQLAALSLRDQPDADACIERFADDDRHVADYLTEQILERQPATIHDFLLTTSVLDRMSAPLCDHVTGGSGAQAMLDELDRRGMFIDRLDADRGWYRYHPLFRTLLRQHLHDTDVELERALLRRAAEWHREHDELETGVDYLLEAGAWQDVLDTAVTRGRELLGRGHGIQVSRWIAAVPQELRQSDTGVTLLEAAGLAASGHLAARDLLDAVDATPSAPTAHLAASSLIRSYAALDHGEPAAAVTAADQALRLAEDAREEDLPDLLGLTGSRADLARNAKVVKASSLVYLWRFDEARALHDEIPEAGDMFVQLAAFGSRALLEAWAGRLSFADRLGQRAVSLARRFDVDRHPIASDAFLALAAVARERAELDRARGFLDEIRQASSERRRLLRILLAIEHAKLALAEEHPAAGLTILASRRAGEHGGTPPPIIAARQAVEAQLLLSLGDLAGARRALDRAPVETSDVVATRVRLAIEGDDLDRAGTLLDRWPMVPDPRAGLEQRLWRAVLDHVRGDEASALRRMADVAAEAEQERNVLLFRHPQVVGPARALYREAPSPFVRMIVDLAPSPSHAGRVKELVEQLTEREYMVLPLLPTRMSNIEIAETLGVSLNTVKTHLKHIYRKLGVTDRGEAIAEAERLHLF